MAEPEPILVSSTMANRIVDIRDQPDVYRRELASGLKRLGSLLEMLGDSTEAANILEEAQQISGETPLA